MTEEELEEQLAPHRRWREEQFAILEEEWVKLVDSTVAKVATVIRPLEVHEWWIDYLKSEQWHHTAAHFKRVEELDAEFMKRTQHIWDAFFAASR